MEYTYEAFRSSGIWLYIVAGLCLLSIPALIILAVRRARGKRVPRILWCLPPFILLAFAAYGMTTQSFEVVEWLLRERTVRPGYKRGLLTEMPTVATPVNVAVFGGLGATVLSVVAAWGSGIASIAGADDDAERHVGTPVAIGMLCGGGALAIAAWLVSSGALEGAGGLHSVGLLPASVVAVGVGSVLVSMRRAPDGGGRDAAQALSMSFLLFLAVAGASMYVYYTGIQEVFVELEMASPPEKERVLREGVKAVCGYSWFALPSLALAGTVAVATLAGVRRELLRARTLLHVAIVAIAGLLLAAGLLYAFVQTNCAIFMSVW